MSRSRRGFSLMEVLLATSILLASSIALIELATIGRKQAHAAYDLNVAQLLCQAKLDEIVAGIEPVKSVEAAELEDDPGWFYSVEVEPLIHLPRLVAVSVTVFQVSDTISRPIRFSLVRWLPDELADSDYLTREPTTGTASSTESANAKPTPAAPGLNGAAASTGRNFGASKQPPSRGVTP